MNRARRFHWWLYCNVQEQGFVPLMIILQRPSARVCPLVMRYYPVLFFGERENNDEIERVRNCRARVLLSFFLVSNNTYFGCWRTLQDETERTTRTIRVHREGEEIERERGREGRGCWCAGYPYCIHSVHGVNGTAMHVPLIVACERNLAHTHTACAHTHWVQHHHLLRLQTTYPSYF